MSDKKESKKKEKLVCCDPPSGWKYGFPKKVQLSIVNDTEKFKRFLLESGYPEKDIEFALKNMRWL